MTSRAATGNGTPTESSEAPMRNRSSVATRWSLAQARTHPPAMAAPSIAATRGRGKANAATKARLERADEALDVVGPPSSTRRRSAPAEKTRPLPVSTTAERSPSSAEGLDERVEELDVEGVDLAVLEPEHRDVADLVDRDHAGEYGRRQSISSSARSSISTPSCHVPSGPRSYRRITPTDRNPTFV